MHQNYLRVFVQAEGENREAIRSRLASIGYNLEKSPSHVPGIVMEKRGLDNPDEEEQQLLGAFPDQSFLRVYDYGRAMGADAPPTIDYISIAFKGGREGLDSVRVFQAYLLKEHQLKIDMGDIEAAENFRLLEGLISGLSLLLMVFSAIAVILFVSNVVTSYLDRQKRSIGTLKAFGLTDNFIIRLFVGISTTLILSGFLLGALLSYLLGSGISLFVELGEGAEQLEFVQWPFPWLFLGFVVLPAGLISGILYVRLLGKTPGDLVYERD
jgi:hypothetical protein